MESSYLSHISNKIVFARARTTKYTAQLLQRQLLLLGKIARAPPDDPLRKLTFQPGTMQLVTDKFVRRVGRPRHEWAGQLLREAHHLKDLIGNASDWHAAVLRHCRA